MKMVLLSFLLCGCSALAYGAAAGRLCEPVHRDEQLRDDESRCGLPAGYDERGPLQRDGVGEVIRFDKDSQWWSTPYSADNNFFTGFCARQL